MKRIVFLAIGFFFLMGGMAFGADATVTSDIISGDKQTRVLILSGVGNISNTDLDSTNLSRSLVGWFPWEIIVTNVAATTVTDDSDVYLKDSGARDLLLAKGVDQLDNTTSNHVDIHSSNPIAGTPYLDVDNQAEAAGAYTITITFVK